MALKYTNIFHCKALFKIYPNFWFENMPSGNPGVRCHDQVISDGRFI
jgi:hypothetical protein